MISWREGYNIAMRSLTFLLGAGASLPAGLPSTAEITRRVLQVHPVIRHSDTTYILDQDEPAYLGKDDSYVKRIPRYLEWMKTTCDEFFKQAPGRSTNYEDTLFLVSQVHDSLMWEYENPALQPFIEKIETGLAHLFVPHGPHDFSDYSHARVAQECGNYIIDAVQQLLGRGKLAHNHLSCVISACSDKRWKHVDLITLNHDLLLEHALHSKGIDYADGFSTPVGQARLWKPDSYISQRICLFKPHGSVNWYGVRVKLHGRYRKTVMTPLTNDIEHIEIGEEEDPPLLSPHPLILAGSFNKMLSYSRGIYADLLYYMRSSMAHSKCLLVSGYSFGDKGINSRLIDWVAEEEDRRLVVLHENPERLFQSARGAVRNHWKEWKDAKQLIVVERWLSDANYDDLLRLCSHG